MLNTMALLSAFAISVNGSPAEVGDRAYFVGTVSEGKVAVIATLEMKVIARDSATGKLIVSTVRTVNGTPQRSTDAQTPDEIGNEDRAALIVGNCELANGVRESVTVGNTTEVLETCRVSGTSATSDVQINFAAVPFMMGKLYERNRNTGSVAIFTLATYSHGP